MNGRKAKEIRRYAAVRTVGRPRVQYEGEALPVYVPQYGAMGEVTEHLKIAKGSPRTLTQSCTRYVSQHLKRAHHKSTH